MSSDPYKSAKKKVKAKKGFFRHLSVYLSVNTIMFLVVFLSGEGFQWTIPTLMWGMALLIHYFGAFGLPGIGAFDSKAWEGKEIRKELRKQGYEIDDDFIDDDDDDDDLELREQRKAPRNLSDDDFV